MFLGNEFATFCVTVSALSPLFEILLRLFSFALYITNVCSFEDVPRQSAKYISIVPS